MHYSCRRSVRVALLSATSAVAATVCLSLCLVCTSCRHSPPIATWPVTGEKTPPVTMPEQEALPPAGANPWAGTVSHHLLADKLIDTWFSELAKYRSVKTFVIISPSHYGLSTQTWSLDNCSWNVGNGITVKTDSKKEKQIAKKLGVSYDSQVFSCEHGVNTLVPYIARYFPKAKICAIAVHGEPPLNQRNAQFLADALAPYFTEEGKTQNFLLISTDFAHHGNYAGTEFKDNRSREFFNAPSNTSWIYCGCDNRPGVYTLAQFLTPKTKSSILYHTNSFALSGHGSNDITSYFFSYFY